jgi:hypothetical protein
MPVYGMRCELHLRARTVLKFDHWYRLLHTYSGGGKDHRWLECRTVEVCQKPQLCYVQAWTVGLGVGSHMWSGASLGMSVRIMNDFAAHELVSGTGLISARGSQLWSEGAF